MFGLRGLMLASASQRGRGRSISHLLLAVILLCVSASAAWSQGASYQGRLVQGDGSPLTGLLSRLELKIYDREEGGDPLYEEAHSNAGPYTHLTLPTKA